MEPRRVIIAVLLMAVVLIVTPLLFPTPKTVGTPALSAADSVFADSVRADSVRLAAASASAAAGSAAGTDTMTARPALAATGAQTAGNVADATAGTTAGANAQGAIAQGAIAPTLIPIDTTVVPTPLATFRTSNRGASLIGAELMRYKELRSKSKVKGDFVELANPGERLLSFRLVVPGDTIRLDTTRFQTTRSEANGLTTVTYATTVQTHPVSITYSFLPDSYRVNIAAHADGVAPNSFLLVDMPPGFASAEADTVDDRSHLSYAYKPDKQNAKAITFKSLDPGERRIESGPINWVVAKNKYFLFGVLTPVGKPGFVELDAVGGVRTGKVPTRAQATAILPLSNGDASIEVYSGPQEFKRLVAMGREFETSNPYGGWLQGVVQPFATFVIKLLLWMKATLGVSYGWILVIFGVTVRLVLWPLNQRAMRSSMAMQRIQPEMQALQAKHKGDPQKLQAEMMRLYKDHNMSPFSSLAGCLPMLVPLPIFFALFFVFQNTIEFRGVSFLWLPDISIKDPFYILPIFVAITAMLLSYIGMRGSKTNDQQKMMMYMMPAMMLFIFLNMASGLNLYYLIQNLASLPQQWLIAHERSRQGPLVRG